VAAHHEDAEEELADTKEFTAETAKQDFTGISKVLDVRVSFTEEANVVASVCSEKTEANNKDNSWDETQGSDSCGQ
jgi:hypothetical protein